MKTHRTLCAAVLGTGLVAALILAFALARRVPNVGYDFQYFLPRLIDVYLHQRQEGFFAIQWWTPSFGAGLPAFFNPQHTQFMLAQWLTPLLGPWDAATAQAAVFNALGSMMVVWVCNRRLNCSLASATLAGLTFAGCGFTWEHALMGHLSFHTFPLVAIVPEALHREVSPMRSVLWLTLTVAAIVYGGGYTIIVIFGLTCLLLMFLLPWGWPEGYALSQVVRRLALGALTGTGAVAMKVAAVMFFLNSFPRLSDYSLTDASFLGVPALAEQLFGLRIFLGFARWLPTSGLEFQPWITQREDVGYGVATLAILAAGAVMLWRSRRGTHWLPANRRLALAAFAALWITAEFALGRGLLWPLLKPLPFLRSLHENYRFAAAFALPLALAVAPCWSALTARLPRLWLGLATAAAGLGTLASIDPYVRINPQNSWFSNYDLTPNQTAWAQLRAHPDERFVITRVADVRDDITFPAHASSWKPYEPIFGYGYGGPEFQITFPPGPVERVNEPPGAWRFHDPRLFIAPGLTTTQRFSPWLGDDDALKHFLDRHQPEWTQPTALRVGMAITCATFLVLLSCVLRNVGCLTPRPTASAAPP